METEFSNKAPARPETPRVPLRELVLSLTGDIKAFFRQEIELAKAEASEKAAWLTRNAIVVAAGGFVAYAGLIVFLIGLGWLVAWALQKAGLSPVFAGFLGLAIIGLFVSAFGALFVLKSIRALANGSLSPQRTLHTMQRLKNSETPPAAAVQPAPARRPSSQEIQKEVEQTEDRMGEELEELGRRLSPQQINARMKQRISRKPYRSGLLAMGLGVLSGMLFARESRR